MTDNDILYWTYDSAFQVNNLLQVAQKFQAAASESGPAGVSNNDAQTICNMLVILYLRAIFFFFIVLTQRHHFVLCC